MVGSFATSDNTCANCRNGWQSNCLHREFMSTCQADYVRIPNAQGTLAVSDVMGTGWYAALAAEVKPGATAVVVGDGAVGLCGVIAAKELGAERVIAMSRHASRQKLALEFGATTSSPSAARKVSPASRTSPKVSAPTVCWSASAPQAMQQALRSARPGGNVGFIGVPHDVAIDGQELFFSHVGLRGGPAPVRRYLPDLINLVLTGRINLGKVFDLTLPLEQVAEGDGRAPRHQGPPDPLTTNGSASGPHPAGAAPSR